MIFKKIHAELVLIRKELQGIRSILESRTKNNMSSAEIFYRSLSNRERRIVNWALSQEKDSETLKAIKNGGAKDEAWEKRANENLVQRNGNSEERHTKLWKI